MSQPDFSARLSPPVTAEQRAAWCIERAREFRAAGATFEIFRKESGAVVAEAWLAQPATIAA